MLHHKCFLHILTTGCSPLNFWNKKQVIKQKQGLESSAVLRDQTSHEIAKLISARSHLTVLYKNNFTPQMSDKNIRPISRVLSVSFTRVPLSICTWKEQSTCFINQWKNRTSPDDQITWEHAKDFVINPCLCSQRDIKNF